VAATDLQAEDIFGILLRFGSLIFSGFSEEKVVFSFGDFVSAGRVGFALINSEFDKFTEQKICVSNVNDSSLILNFSAAIFFSQ
jgi:hypothetical protein